MGYVYFLKLRSPLGNNRHSVSYYVGSTKDDSTLERRLRAHWLGDSCLFMANVARLDDATDAKCIGFDLLGIVECDDPRAFEIQVKKWKNHRLTFERLQRQGRVSNPDWIHKELARIEFNIDPFERMMRGFKFWKAHHDAKSAKKRQQEIYERYEYALAGD